MCRRVGDVGDVGGRCGREMWVGGRCNRIRDSQLPQNSHGRRSPPKLPPGIINNFWGFFPESSPHKNLPQECKNFHRCRQHLHIFICQSNYFASGPNIVYVSKNNFQKMSSYFLNIRKSLKYDHSWTLRNFCQHWDIFSQLVNFYQHWGIFFQLACQAGIKLLTCTER